MRDPNRLASALTGSCLPCMGLSAQESFPLGLPLTFQALNTTNQVAQVATPLTLVLY